MKKGENREEEGKEGGERGGKGGGGRGGGTFLTSENVKVLFNLFIFCIYF